MVPPVRVNIYQDFFSPISNIKAILAIYLIFATQSFKSLLFQIQFVPVGINDY